ncbi:hypothetical protein V5799_000205 [Amblyomma americanum]|uniref:Uncharacterized protein n=1 Tax=Amblyomma americanum TaxID=6943 RepID=A0AAQ4D3Q1_AMBAM
MSAREAGNGLAAGEDAVFDDEQVSQRTGQSAGPDGAVPSPVAPLTPKSGSELPVTVDPAYFAKALAMGEERIRRDEQRATQRRISLFFGACVCVAAICVLAALGTAVFSKPSDSLSAATQTPVSAGNYTVSTHDMAARLSKGFDRDGTSETVIEGNATSPDPWSMAKPYV